MHKFYRTLLIACLMVFAGSIYAQDVQRYESVIHNGNDSTYQAPTNTWFKYSLTEMIYTYSYMPSPSDCYLKINSISFYYTGYTTSGDLAPYSRNITVYMKNVNQNKFNSTNDYIPVTSDDWYFSGTVSSEGAGWVTINLSHPFYYKNYSGCHLLIAIDDNTGAIGQREFRVLNSSYTTGGLVRFASDSQDFSATSFDASSASGYVENFIPTMKINYDLLLGAEMPYYCDFENASDRNEWMTKNTNDNMNAGWYINNSGNHSLMCGDGQGNANYQTSDQSVTVLAERLIRMSQADQIDIKFSLNVGGEDRETSCYDYVMVFLAPQAENWEPSNSTTSYTGSSTDWELPYALHFSNDILGTKLTHKNWEDMQVTIDNPNKGATYKLIFVWHNDESDGDGIAATIDNIAVVDHLVYDINVAGTMVTTLNKDGVTGDNISGTITFDPTTRILTLDNATINGNININEGNGEAVIYPIINLVGDNTLNGSINLNTSQASEVTSMLTISGTGSLQAESMFLQAGIDAFIQDCEVNFESPYSWCAYGYGNNYFIFENARARFKANSYALGDIAGIGLTNSHVTIPENYTMVQHPEIPNTTGYFVCDSQGNPANEVVILRDSDGIAQNEATKLNVYPNPANDKLYVEGADGETVKVYDNTGRLVMEQIYRGSLNISELTRGIYAITTGERTVKFVKK